MISYYGEDGCCLTCEKEEKREGCLCYDCKCKKCRHYNPSAFDSSTPYYDSERWFVCDLAERWKKEAEKRYEERTQIIYFFDFEIKRETEKGILVKKKEKEFWLPKSQVEFRECLIYGKAIGIPKWLVDKSSLLEKDGYYKYECSFQVQSKLK
jgi:hypothetical protein